MHACITCIPHGEKGVPKDTWMKYIHVMRKQGYLLDKLLANFNIFKGYKSITKMVSEICNTKCTFFSALFYT
jgi:hypothetical protein